MQVWRETYLTNQLRAKSSRVCIFSLKVLFCMATFPIRKIQDKINNWQLKGCVSHGTPTPGHPNTSALPRPHSTPPGRPPALPAGQGSWISLTTEYGSFSCAPCCWLFSSVSNSLPVANPVTDLCHPKIYASLYSLGTREETGCYSQDLGYSHISLKSQVSLN